MKTRGSEVLEMLIPTGGWIITGDEYEGIQFLECEPITKKQFTDAFAQFDALKQEQEAAKATAKEALFERLSITAEEATLLLG